MSRPERPRALLAATWALLALTGVHLVAQLVDARSVASGTQMLLMPALATWFALRLVPGRGDEPMARLVLVALFFSWLGDTLPRFATGDRSFLLMVGGFLLAQLVYARAFWPLRDRSLLLRAPGWLALYGVLLVGLVVLVAPTAGPLTAAVGVYGAALCTMSVLASGLGRAGLLGGLVFLVSDAMIGLGAFTSWGLPAGGFWVMLTYVGGQWLLADAVARHLEGLSAAGPAVPPPAPAPR